MARKPNMRLYHTGIIVDSLQEAMETWSEALDLAWAPPKTATTPMLCADGVLDREVRFTYSLQGPHFIELLEQVNAAPYVNLTGGRRVHHLGYLTDDLETSSQELQERGFRRELSGVDHDGNIARAAFHYSPESPGMWIELVASDTAGEINRWVADAAEAQGIPYQSPFA